MKIGYFCPSFPRTSPSREATCKNNGISGNRKAVRHEAPHPPQERIFPPAQYAAPARRGGPRRTGGDHRRRAVYRHRPRTRRQRPRSGRKRTTGEGDQLRDRSETRPAHREAAAGRAGGLHAARRPFHRAGRTEQNRQTGRRRPLRLDPHQLQPEPERGGHRNVRHGGGQGQREPLGRDARKRRDRPRGGLHFAVRGLRPELLGVADPLLADAVRLPEPEFFAGATDSGSIRRPGQTAEQRGQTGGIPRPVAHADAERADRGGIHFEPGGG